VFSETQGLHYNSGGYRWRKGGGMETRQAWV
jgi:hypothetical protein